MKFLGIYGKSGTGKDTAAKIIKEHIFPNAIIINFATYLKGLCTSLYPLCPGEEDCNRDRSLRNKVIPEYGMTPVQIWIHIGEALRAVNPDIFIDKLVETVEITNKTDRIIIVPDLRFPNEFDFFASREQAYTMEIKAEVEDNPDAKADGLLHDRLFDQTILNAQNGLRFYTKQLEVACKNFFIN